MKISRYEKGATMYTITEADWKVLRKYLPQWQERYMERLCREYVALLNSEQAASDRFWALEKRIREDKKAPASLRI